jgi:hypothetical protein
MPYRYGAAGITRTATGWRGSASFRAAMRGPKVDRPWGDVLRKMYSPRYDRLLDPIVAEAEAIAGEGPRGIRAALRLRSRRLGTWARRMAAAMRRGSAARALRRAGPPPVRDLVGLRAALVRAGAHCAKTEQAIAMIARSYNNGH